ncbi:MAG TPA: ribokinase [Thermomicrobiales bacterium]|nr:ribokinase [Thermomicrobiales bacterium]
MSRRILVAGAINTDLVASVDRAPEAGETITGRSFSIHSGGKGANQAVAASRSGAKAVMLGGVGNDDFGSGRMADLAADGIDTNRVMTIDDASSGVALITVEASGENRICYVPGATLRVTPEHAREAVEAIQPDVVLAANELSIDCLRDVFSWAKKHDVPVIYNVAPYSEDARQLLPMVDILMVNRGEAAALQGCDPESKDAADLAAGVFAMGVSSVVVTLGGDGAYAVHQGDAYHAPAMKVDVVDTTGAGDTFCGAFAARYAEGASFREAVRYASAAGALATTKQGAQSSIPARDEIESVLGGRRSGS